MNHGIILGQREQDWMAGSFTFISYEERNPSGDWTPYLVTKEKQYGKQDSMSCVSFSACSSIEIQEKFLTGKEVNYSDRWIAKRSGTTVHGNWMYVVGDTIRRDGLVREERYPAPPNYTFNEYHADIQEPLLSELKKEGQEWLSEWDIKTEFVPATKESILKHVKHAPLQLATLTHAIVFAVAAGEDGVTVFDTYPHSGDYLVKIPYSQIEAAYKYVLTPKQMPKRFIINDDGKLGVMTLEGFTGTVQFCDKFEDWDEFKKLLKVDDSTPTISIPQ